MSDWQHLDKTYILPTFGRMPIAIAKAEKNVLIDTKGNRYLDLFTGLAVNILGHSYPRLMKALAEQGKQFLHISNIFLNTPAIRLAERLVKHSLKTGKVYFGNSGAEATEAAIKLIHKWSVKHAPQKKGIIVLKNSFHGRTLGALKLTRQPGIYQDFPQIDLPVFEIEVNQTTQLEQVCEQFRPAAVLVEPILGSGGIVLLTKEFLETIQQLCQKHQMLFCVDEIQAGMGRTGTLFAYQAFSLKPDLILFGKGVGGGLPLGGVIAGEKLLDAFQPGDHGTTFAPSPLSAALGNAVLDALFEDGMLEKGKQTADYLWSRLNDLQTEFPTIIQSINGRGMMIGIRTCFTKEEIKALQTELMNDGILINITAQTVIRLLPPLTLTDEEIEFFITTLQRRLQQRLDKKEV
ncbi:aspartate aminotransferase family protein [Thermoactinomyces mirandus]|uniref:Acetylornithine transaminase n=1 Tax=Thermoactinomyces mirandus TaxID=2756294 RepID=A0A7W1XQS8_9BACL|nr:acetylornithine transaminase [Thermoactinomyces mirandus]MBA4601578.1 acetylornithine transaminase [Thermoactinomyces mirandus]